MPSPPATILLVDDEAPLRDMMRATLEKCGYFVLDATSYDDAVRTYKKHRHAIQLLITDISLPGNNGYELAGQISQWQPNIKVIFTSGKAGMELCRFYYMPEGDPRLLKKPFGMSELVQRVAAALSSGGAKSCQATGLP